MAITIDWLTSIIHVPQSFLTPVGGSVYQLDTNAFRVALRDIEDNDEGITFPPTHSHNTAVTLGGIQYARVIEILAPYTITFEETGSPYVVSLVGSNNNILERTNLGTVQLLSNNSAGLINVSEIQQAAFEGRVAIDAVNGEAGTTYPIGTLARPVNNITDAKAIATARSLGEFYIVGNLTVGATDNVAGLNFVGGYSTLNVAGTTVTLTQGCVTTNSKWKDCKITGYQGGESVYINCIIDGLENAHCIYDHCGLLDGTSRGYTIKQTSAVSSGHASYFRDCFSDESTAILDRNGARLNVTFDGWSGRLTIINQNHATSSGQVWIHMNGGTVTIDSSCTKGKITVTGTGTLINHSLGTEVDATSFLSEGFEQIKLNIESFRQTHQGFGARWFVDPINGNDIAPGNSSSSPVQTITAAIAKAVSGRGDVIYLLAPGEGTVTAAERIVINKEDLHIRGPGRGFQIQPASANEGPTISITANNCSLSGFIVRCNASSTTDDAITISGKFSRLDKLYVVGPGQGVGSGSGVVYTHGDYHEMWDMEIEKFGSGAVKTDDLSGGAGNGSPREISIFGGNFYLNGSHGFHLHGADGVALGSTTRIIRILSGARIHDNTGYGIHTSANTSGVLIDDSVVIHSNNGGSANPQALLEGTGYYKEEAEKLALAAAVRSELAVELARLDVAVSSVVHSLTAQEIWEYGVRTLTTVNGLTEEQANQLLDIARIHGLVPGVNLVVNGTENTRSAGPIVQLVTTAGEVTTVSRM